MQGLLIKTETSDLQIVGALRLTASGTVSEKISLKRVGPCRWHHTRAAPIVAAMMICMDDVDGPFVIVLVALLAVCDLNVPTEVIVQDFERANGTSAQASWNAFRRYAILTTTIMTETPSL